MVEEDGAGSTGAGAGAPFQGTAPMRTNKVLISKMTAATLRVLVTHHSLPRWWRTHVMVEFSHIVVIGLKIKMI